MVYKESFVLIAVFSCNKNLILLLANQIAEFLNQLYLKMMKKSDFLHVDTDS